MGDPIENSSDNPEYIIGGNVYLMNSNFIQSNGRSLDHELLYRLQNSNTYGIEQTWAGIYKTSPLVLNNFNREHQRLLRQLVMTKEDGDNDLIALDYVRNWFSR